MIAVHVTSNGVRAVVDVFLGEGKGNTNKHFISEDKTDCSI